MHFLFKQSCANYHGHFRERFQTCFCSVARSCPTLCDPMDCSTPGFPVLHCLPEFAQLMSTESVLPSISSSVIRFSSRPLSFPMNSFQVGVLSKISPEVFFFFSLEFTNQWIRLKKNFSSSASPVEMEASSRSSGTSHTHSSTACL